MSQNSLLTTGRDDSGRIDQGLRAAEQRGDSMRKRAPAREKSEVQVEARSKRSRSARSEADDEVDGVEGQIEDVEDRDKDQTSKPDSAGGRRNTRSQLAENGRPAQKKPKSHTAVPSSTESRTSPQIYGLLPDWQTRKTTPVPTRCVSQPPKSVITKPSVAPPNSQPAFTYHPYGGIEDHPEEPAPAADAITPSSRRSLPQSQVVVTHPARGTAIVENRQGPSNRNVPQRGTGKVIRRNDDAEGREDDQDGDVDERPGSIESDCTVLLCIASYTSDNATERSPPVQLWYRGYRHQ
ncbi:hypothetical protein L210DRAFT_3641468 [Boletus edulis BED1]|uniref:Uncharacterized protein n=1 Tax=Boletus edulis BED1 TaxID=1328754 RepID=A0AAD4C4I7_BOLED|nr:hypothetical protein L210DRAFT_3641468 [Boletus edulis BED1]